MPVTPCVVVSLVRPSNAPACKVLVHSHTSLPAVLWPPALSVDGVALVTGGADSTVRVWGVAAALEDMASRAEDTCANLRPSSVFHTKSTPVNKVTWTRRNLLLAGGAFELK